MAPAKKRIARTANPLNELTQIRNAFLSGQMALAQFERSFKPTNRNIGISQELTLIKNSLTLVHQSTGRIERRNLSAADTSHQGQIGTSQRKPQGQLVTPQQALVARIYNAEPMKRVCPAHHKFGKATPATSCPGPDFCSYVAPAKIPPAVRSASHTLPTTSTPPNTAQIGKENQTSVAPSVAISTQATITPLNVMDWSQLEMETEKNRRSNELEAEELSMAIQHELDQDLQQQLSAELEAELLDVSD